MYDTQAQMDDSKGEQREAWIVDYKDQSGVRAQRTFSHEDRGSTSSNDMRGEVRDKKHVIASKEHHGRGSRQGMA